MLRPSLLRFALFSCTVILGLVPAVSTHAQIHPRLFFDAADVPALRAKVQTAPYSDMLAGIIRNINSVDYAQRGGNIGAAYLLTGDEMYARMGALRMLDLIANTTRWENGTTFGLRRGIDIVAAAHLYDFCYNSTTWRDYVVPATVSSEAFTINGVSNLVPGTGAKTTTDGVFFTSYTPRTITIPSKYVGLPLREAVSRAIKNNADSLMTSGGAEWPGDTKTGNNWHAVRFGGAGLGYLVSDTPSGTSLNSAITNLKKYLTSTLGTGYLGLGWSPEGISYAQYPGWTTYPLAIALKRAQGRDLVAEHPAMRYALWSTYMGILPLQRSSRLGAGLGVKPDFDDDHNIWDGEGTAALAFAFAYNDNPADKIADFDYRPGLKYMYRRLSGDLGDRNWDGAAGNGIYSILYYPDVSMPEQNPDQVWGRTFYDPSYGAVMMRSGHQNADFSPFSGGKFTVTATDIVFQTTANLRSAEGGHGGPDGMGLRLTGLGVPWIVGSGRVWAISGQSSLIADDPESLATGTMGITPFAQEVRDIFLRPNTGDGFVTLRADTSDTGTENHTRRIVTDYSGQSGAAGFFIVSDSCTTAKPWWRLQTPSFNTVDSSTPGQFIITSPEGHRLLGKILYPSDASLRTGTFKRGNAYAFGDQTYPENKWVDFHALEDGEVLVALALVPSGQPLPVINVSGDRISGFNVTAGTASYTIKGDTVTSPLWNPPAVSITAPAKNQYYLADATATATIPVSGTATDDGSVRKLEIFVDDVPQQTLDVNAATLDWGPVNLTGITVGDHILKVIATDNSGDTRTTTTPFRVTNSIPPVIELTSPTTSTPLVAGQSVLIQGTASDLDPQAAKAIQRIEIWDDFAATGAETTLTKRGEATYDATSRTWSFLYPNFLLGRHSLYAVAVSADGDQTRTPTLELTASLRISDTDPVYGDAGNYSRMAGLNATSRIVVVNQGDNLVFRQRESQNYDYINEATYLLDSNPKNRPNFEVSWRARMISPLSVAPFYFFKFAQGTTLELETINSVDPFNSWASGTNGTRVWWQNGSFRTAIAYTLDTHKKTDAGYPNAALNTCAGIPNADWNQLKVRRVGKNLKVWVNAKLIMDTTENRMGLKSLVGLGNDAGAGHVVLFDDVTYTTLDANGIPYNDTGSALAFTGPAQFAQLAAGQAVTLTGTAADPDGLATLELYRGATKLADLPTTGGAWSWTWTAPVLGTYQFHLVATDTRGFVTRSAPLRLTVAATAADPLNSPPSVTLARDASTFGSLRLAGSVTDRENAVAGVQILRNGLPVGMVSMSGRTWNIVLTGEPKGTVTYVARAWDQAGLSTDSTALTLNLAAPSLVLSGLPANNTFIAGRTTQLTMSANGGFADVVSIAVSANGRSLGQATLNSGVWTFGWSPSFHGQQDLTFVATDAIGSTVTSVTSVNVVPDSGATASLLTYAGGAGKQEFLDTMELSDGTVLIAGTADNLNWTPATKTPLTVAGFASSATTKTAFLLRVSADLQTVLGVYHLPAGHVTNLRWIKTTSKPGAATTGDLYVSGATNATGGYFIAKLDNNFINGTPTGFAWVRTATLSSAYGDNLGLQTWDVGGDGRVVFADEAGSALRVFFASGADGSLQKLNDLRASHWPATGPLDNVSRTQEIGANVASATRSGITVPSDLRSWTDADRLTVLGDGNGHIKRGKWPLDLFFPVQDKNGLTTGTIEYGYTGYKSVSKHRLGGITVDRDTNDFYLGFNIQSKFWGKAPGATTFSEVPDFEPAVIGYTATGAQKWWSRLYTEVVDANKNGQIDAGETRISLPDQYVDGLTLDYSAALSRLVVLGRSHGNDKSNLWKGNAIAATPSANGFHNQFTGTEGNIHVSWLGKLAAADGSLLRATYVAGYFRSGVTHNQTLYSEPIHDQWPSHNAGWPNLTTTRVEPGSVRVDASGRVYVVGGGPRMVTTSNAHQKIPRKTPLVDEGDSPWAAFVRVFDTNLSTLAYSSAVTGVWTYPSTTSQPIGADNTQLFGVFPTNNGALIVGLNKETGGVALGNPVPVAKVPAWGSATPTGQDALFGRLSFNSAFNAAPIISAIAKNGTNAGVTKNGITFTVGDAETPAAALLVTATSSNPALVAPAGITLGGSDANRTINLRPEPGLVGVTVITVTVSDGERSTTSAFTFTVATGNAEVPVVTLTAPLPNELLPVTGSYTLTATATNPGSVAIARVEFYLDGIEIGEDTTTPYSLNWNTSGTTDGVHVFHARAVNAAGFATTSAETLVYFGSRGGTPVVQTPPAYTPSSASTAALSVTATDAEDPPALLTYTWSLLSGPTGGTVTFNPNGTALARNAVATFNRVGTYQLRLVIADTSLASTQTTLSVIVEPAVTSIALSPSASFVSPLGTKIFSAVFRDQFAQPMTSTNPLTWSVSGGGTIDASGLFTAGVTLGGPFVVTASSGSLAGTASVSITTQLVTSITASPASASVTINQTQQFTATAKDQNGATITPAPAFAWSVSGGGTIDGNGLFTAGSTAGGPFVVTASSGGVSVTTNVTITQQVVKSITVSPTSASVPVNQTQQFTAIAKDQNGATLTPAPAFVWSVSGGGTITSTGLFTAGATAGDPYTITASASGINGTTQCVVTAETASEGALYSQNFDSSSALTASNQSVSIGSVGWTTHLGQNGAIATATPYGTVTTWPYDPTNANQGSQARVVYDTAAPSPNGRLFQSLAGPNGVIPGSMLSWGNVGSLTTGNDLAQYSELTLSWYSRMTSGSGSGTRAAVAIDTGSGVQWYVSAVVNTNTSASWTTSTADLLSPSGWYALSFDGTQTASSTRGAFTLGASPTPVSLPEGALVSVGVYSQIQSRSDSVRIDSLELNGVVMPDPQGGFKSWIGAYPEVGALSGLADDPDNDGIVNLLEYALDGDPTQSILSMLPVSSVDASNKLTLSFNRMRSDLTYTVQASSNLVAWTDIAVNPGSIGETVTVTDTVTLNAGVRRFLRLKVTAP